MVFRRKSGVAKRGEQAMGVYDVCANNAAHRGVPISHHSINYQRPRTLQHLAAAPLRLMALDWGDSQGASQALSHFGSQPLNYDMQTQGEFWPQYHFYDPLLNAFSPSMHDISGGTFKFPQDNFFLLVQPLIEDRLAELQRKVLVITLTAELCLCRTCRGRDRGTAEVGAAIWPVEAQICLIVTFFPTGRTRMQHAGGLLLSLGSARHSPPFPLPQLLANLR